MAIEPDGLDLLLIKEATMDNEETIALDDLVKELGFTVDELQD